MPVNRKRITRERKPEGVGLEPWQEKYLLHGDEIPGLKFFFWRRDESEQAWAKYRKELLKTWIRQNPGTRPFAWWQHDAPHEPLVDYDPEHWRIKSAPIRKRLGGTGTPSHALPGGDDSLLRGIPTVFVDEFDIQEFHDWDTDREDLPARETLNIAEPPQLYDPEDPPLYESEAAYLQRHGLLKKAETKWLENYPEAFDPVVAIPETFEEAEEAENTHGEVWAEP